MKLIGDPHLGRVFKANVPLDRRGDREEMMFAEFEKQINDPLNTSAVILIVGDLFEHWFIDYKYLYRTIKILQEWHPRFPMQRIVIMQGNHDYSPTKEVKGAFDILDLAMKGNERVHIVRKPTVLFGVALFPWEWDRTALEQLNDITLWPDTAVGHWDLVDYGGDTGHLCPARALQEAGVKRIVSGHWHLAGIYSVDGVDVECTGSMQPMTHAEDPKGNMYVSLTAREYANAPPDSFRDKYVRVMVDKGEAIVAPPDCLGFKTQFKPTERQEAERVTLGDFDIQKILDTKLKQHTVPDEVQKEIKERLVDIS